MSLRTGAPDEGEVSPRVELPAHRVKLGYSDMDRMVMVLEGIVGKRLTYRRTDESRYA